MAKVCPALPGPNHQQPSTPSITTPALPPPRRPRVREVSSRFMSPIVSSSSSGDLHLPSSKNATTTTSASSTHHHNSQQRSQSAQRRETHLNESLSYADENKYERTRSLDTPFGSLNKQPISLQKKHQQQMHCDGMQQLRASCSNKFPMRSSSNFTRSRPDTPLVQGRDGTTNKVHTSPRSSKTVVASVASTAAAKLVQGMGSSGASEIPVSKCVKSLNLDSQHAETVDTSRSSVDSCEPKPFINPDQESICTSPVRVQNPKVRPLQDVRSSMPETDLLPMISSKLLAHNRDTPKTSSLQNYRYLTSPLPSFEPQFVPGTAMSVCRPPPPNGVSLPPHPPSAKLGVEARKVTKVSNRQEQVHSLRMLHNHHLQWRYANAKAEAAMHAQSVAAEKSFHAIAAKISELHDSVNEKQAELRHLKKERTLSTVLEAQMPHLNEWSTLEDEYTNSLGGAIQALRDTSLRLPISGSVKADTGEVGKALNSASNVMEVMVSVVESLLPKGGEMDCLSAELAEVVNSERGLIEECNDLLSRTHMLQVVECSLRAQLVQLKLYNSLQKVT